jgi:hypothetical protein
LQNRCHTFLDCPHICKTCVFHDALQVGKQKEVHPPYSPYLVPVGTRSGEYGEWTSFCFPTWRA